MKLQGWSLHPLSLPYPRKIVWANAEESASSLLLLRLVAEDGSVGAAEVAVKPRWFGTTYRSIVSALEDIFLPIAKGVDVVDETAFYAAAKRIPEHTSAKGLVDTALWDLRSAIERRPLWQRWAGESRAPLSWILTRQSPALMAAEAAQAVEKHGFREIKLKGGQGPETDVRVIREVRAAAGGALRIYVDANSHYSAEETPGYLQALGDAGVLAVEDPYAMQPDARFELIQRQAAVPILVDAPGWLPRDAALFCGRGAQAIALKPGRSGLSAAWEQARIAALAGCRVHVGWAGESAFGTLSSLQLAASLPGREQWLAAEISYFLLLSEQFISAPLKVVEGLLELPAISSCAELVDWEKVERLSAAL